MEVGPRDASCRSHLSKHLARFQIVSDLHVNFGKVPVEGVDAEPVINDDSVSGKEEFLRENHSSVLSCVNRGSGRGGEIPAQGGWSWLVGENSAFFQNTALWPP